VAFFDMDGTLVVGHTQVLLVKFMRRAGAVGLLFVLGSALWFLGYKLGVVKLTHRAREMGASMFKGLTETEVKGHMDRFVDDVLVPRLHPGAMAALQAHKARGDRVVVLSAALEPLVEALGRRLGSDACVGADCEIVHGRYTGRIRGPIPHANEKTRVAGHFMSQWGVSPRDCWAYADHESDRDLLRWVGHPVAVNPRPVLLAAAQKAGWQVLS
jgi:HAD superfamily hydrolase (TIGR01490 family)